MFEASQQAKRIEKGQTIEGTIVAIGPEMAFVDVGGTGEATIAIDELKDDEGDLRLPRVIDLLRIRGYDWPPLNRGACPMRNWLGDSVIAGVVAAGLMLAATHTAAQAPAYRAPRTADGK